MFDDVSTLEMYERKNVTSIFFVEQQIIMQHA